MNHGLEPRIRGRLSQSLFENWNREVVVTELGEQEENLRTERGGARLGQKICGNRPRTRPLPCYEVRSRCGERPSMHRVARVRRSQTQRLLGDLGGACRRATIGRKPGGVVEHSGDIGVGGIRRQREVAGMFERIVDDRGDAFVHAAALIPQILVEDRGQEGVAEANRAVVILDDAGAQGRLERVRRHSRPLEQRCGGGTQRRSDGKRVARGRGKLDDPRAHSLAL